MPFSKTWAALARGIDEGAYPGAVAMVGDDTEIIARWHGGNAAVEPHIVPMQESMIFDVASLTKVVATLPAVLHLVEAGEISLDETVNRFISNWVAPEKKHVTIRQLLTHTSGLAAWHPTYAAIGAESKEPTAVDVIAELDLAYVPGTRVEYSCLGYILLGHIVEKVSGQRLDTFAARHVFEPLGMKDTGYRPIADSRPVRHDSTAAHRLSDVPLERFVPTEADNVHEQGTVTATGTAFSAWGNGVAHGVVHDGNARYGLAGVSGNAGLFSTALDLVRYGQEWLRALRGQSNWLAEPVARLATTDHTSGLDSSRGLGWLLVPRDVADRAAGPTPDGPRSCGELLTPGSFGHTGFTGTSLWIDTARSLVFVLLTNRVHPHTREGLAYVRPRFHNAAVTAATSGRAGTSSAKQ